MKAPSQEYPLTWPKEWPRSKSRTNRHGGLNLVRAAFRGYAALPPPMAAGSGKPWHEILGVKAGAPWGEVVAAHKKLAKQNHPDLGGSSNAMAAINEAFQSAKSERGL